MPTVIVIGGPNGAGKTTVARQLLLNWLPESFEFLNADLIAEALSPFRPHRVSTQAGREFLRRFELLSLRGDSFVVESTLSGGILADRLNGLRIRGYRIELVYLWLPDASTAIRRVEQRVRGGGHSIPADVIARRFARSYSNFTQIYRGVADRWTLLDASATPPAKAASGALGREVEIVDAERFARIVAGDIDKGMSLFESKAEYNANQPLWYTQDLGTVLDAVGKFLRAQEDVLGAATELNESFSRLKLYDK